MDVKMGVDIARMNWKFELGPMPS